MAVARRLSPSGAPTRHDGPVIRVTVVDDHAIVRDGLRLLLEAEPDLTVVADAGTVADAIAATRTVATDVVIMDARLAGGSGVIAARAIRSAQPALPVVMLTATFEHEALFLAVMAGACACVIKNVRGHGLADTVRQAAAGRGMLDPAQTAYALGRLADEAGGGEPLTATETYIARLVADGLTNAQIGEALGMPENTVASRVASMLSRDRARRARIAEVLAVRRAPAAGRPVPAG